MCVLKNYVMYKPCPPVFTTSTLRRHHTGIATATNSMLLFEQVTKSAETMFDGRLSPVQVSGTIFLLYLAPRVSRSTTAPSWSPAPSQHVPAGGRIVHPGDIQ